MGFLLRWLVRILLLIYVLIAIVVVGVRYWLLPSIDTWKAPISHAISQITNSHIEIGRLQANWTGLSPEITIHELQILDWDREPQVVVPHIQAKLKWQSLLRGKVHFSSLHIDGLALTMWKDKESRVHIAGQQIDNAPVIQQGEGQGFFTWLAQQDQLVLHHAELTWRDFTRDAPELIISNLTGVVQAQDDKLHFSLSGLPPNTTASQFGLRGFFDRADLENDQLSGQMYVEFKDLHPVQWRQWIDVFPSDLLQAQMNAQFWLDLKANHFTHVAINSELQQAEWSLADQGKINVSGLRFFLQGQWEQVHAFFTHPEPASYESTPIQMQLVAQGVHWSGQRWLSDPLVIDRLELALAPTHTAGAALQLQHFYVRNPDMELSASGSFTIDKKDFAASFFDLHAQIKQVALHHLYKYFPAPFISEAVIEWLEQGLKSGYLHAGDVRWQGHLADYPFKDPSRGIFYVGGKFAEAQVDYYPSSDKEKGWPALHNASGYLTIRGNELWVRKATGQLYTDEKMAIEAESVAVHIDDFSADEPWLEVEALTHGAAQNYLSLMSTTELGSWLGNYFDQSTGSGSWTVPLLLRVNLENSEQTKVQGHIEFDNNTVQLMPELAPFTQVKGKLVFTETQAQAVDITSSWVGGRTQMQGVVGPKKEHMVVTGTLQANEALKFYDFSAIDSYLQGQSRYEARLGFDVNDSFFVELTSSLEGLQSTLPPPLAKAKAKAWPLKVQWQAKNAQQHALTLRLGTELQLELVEAYRKTTFFDKGALAWRQSMSLPKTAGFTIDVNEPQLNISQWESFLALQQTAASEQSPYLPELTRLRLKAQKVEWLENVFTNLTYTLHQLEHSKWRSDISSDQVAGTVRWEQDQKGQVQGIVQVDLQRLHWVQSKPKGDGAKEHMADFELDLPDMDITIADLRLNEWHLGALRAHGRKQEKSVWHIPEFSLENPHGELTASGYWRLKGVGRGLKLSSQLQSTEVGEFLDYLGMTEVIGGGQGSIQAQVFWRDFPWQSSIRQIEAELDVSLHDGRFHQIHSRAAKLLEVLSLQSLSRLATFDLDLRGVMRDGFPFTDLKGQLWIDQQVLYTKNFRVVGPVGTIVLEGKTDLIQEHIDMQALVVPSVDMSGAAIAAGIALNPVVGISAFVTQLLFKEPLARAMTVRYGLSGPWDKMEIKEIQLKSQEP